RVAARRLVGVQRPVRMRALRDLAAEHARLARAAGAVAAAVRQHHALAQRRLENELVVADAELLAAGRDGDLEAHGWRGHSRKAAIMACRPPRAVDADEIPPRSTRRAARPAPTLSPTP